MAEDKYFSRNFFLIVLCAFTLLALYVIWPLLTVLFGALLLAYLFYPVYNFIHKKTNMKHVAAWIIIILLLLVIFVPTYFMFDSLTKEGYTLFITVKQKLSDGSLATTDCVATPSVFCEFSNHIVNFLKDPQVKFYLEDGISKISSYIVNKTSDIIVGLPMMALYLVFIFVTVYYLLIDSKYLIEAAKRSIPLKTHHIDHIVQQFNDFAHATLYGHFITAVIQGIIGGTIFFLLGIPTPVLAGLAMAFFAFLPFIGTPIIWVPASLVLFVTGETTKAIILLLLGVFVISTIDNFMRPYIIGNRIRLHPIGVWIGIIGGLLTLGPLGVIAGPLIISLLMSFVEVYYKEGF